MEKVFEKVENIEKHFLQPDSTTQERLEEFGLTDISLRQYQLDGVNWLIERFKRKHGCILGDEMGLGKTCQTISFLTYLLGSGEGVGPHLILSPLSVVGNWKNELSSFSPNIKLVTYIGSKEERPALRNQIKKDSVNVVLTTYEICLKDEEFLQKIGWHTLVVDEAHRLKNRDSLLHQALLDFDVEHRLLLTGTPVQNNLKELYSLLCFVAPKIFRSRFLECFIEQFENKTENQSELHGLLRPFLIRRLKAEVVKDLPKKSEVILYHGLSALQKKYYKAILTKDTEPFENENRSVKTSLMNVLMQLRKCVNHPYLFDGVEPEPFQLGEHLVESSGKLYIIDRLLSHLKAAKHKVLLFSQMTRMLDIIQDYLGYRGYTYERLDGSVRGEERYLAVQNFNEDDDTFIFLLSTKAGGVGLNLVGADTIVFVDSDFNPQNDLQAAARAHRIGQTRPVKVIRLIGKSTVEEIVLNRAEEKLKLTETVIESGNFSLGIEKDDSSLVEDDKLKLTDVLKFGVDKLLSDEESSVEDINFSEVLGPTVCGIWSDSVPQLEKQPQWHSMDADSEEPSSSLYVFEGTDYSKEPSAADKKAFDGLIAAQKSLDLQESGMEKVLRKTRSVATVRYTAELPVRKPRKKLTPEEIEAREKKKVEAAAKRAEAAKLKKDSMWKENGYKSMNIGIDEEEEEDSGDDNSEDIHYVVGDVTHPQHTEEKDAIVVHCVDDSGRWGYGGLFSAISARSIMPEEQYELAGQMEDLNLGDVHLVPLDDKDNKPTVALIVAQKRDKRNNLSGIKLSALSDGFKCLCKVAKKKKASVHLPRIGHNTPDFNWYGTERLLRKYFARRGIKTYIYYYPRRGTGKRKRTATSTDGDIKKSKDADEGSDQSLASHSQASKPHIQTASSLLRKLSSTKPLPTFLSGVTVYFHEVPEDTVNTLRRFICAYDGDIDEKLGDDTTHVVTLSDLSDKTELEDYQMDYADQIKIVSVEWLNSCFAEKKCVDTKPFHVLADNDL